MDAYDKKFFEQELATIASQERKVNADKIQNQIAKKKVNADKIAIQITEELIKGKREMIERWMAMRSDLNVASSVHFNPPVGTCKTHGDWCFHLVDENRGQLKRHQIVGYFAYVEMRFKCNSQDRKKSASDASSKLEEATCSSPSRRRWVLLADRESRSPNLEEKGDASIIVQCRSSWPLRGWLPLQAKSRNATRINLVAFRFGCGNLAGWWSPKRHSNCILHKDLCIIRCRNSTIACVGAYEYASDLPFDQDLV